MLVAAAMLWVGQRGCVSAVQLPGPMSPHSHLTGLGWTLHWTLARGLDQNPLSSAVRDYGGQYEQFSECHIISFDFHKICNEMQWNCEFDALLING